jgi:hypothetical protein
MGFRKDKTTAAQTAANVAGAVTAANIAATDGMTASAASKYVNTIFEGLFELLAPVVDADNEVFAAQDEAAPAAKAASSGGKRSTGGAKTSGTGKKFTLEEAMELELNSGKFKGQTLGDVYAMDEDEAAEYGHREGEPGKSYVKWLTTEKNPNSYTRDAAKAIIAGKKASSDDDDE